MLSSGVRQAARTACSAHSALTRSLPQFRLGLAETETAQSVLKCAAAQKLPFSTTKDQTTDPGVSADEAARPPAQADAAQAHTAAEASGTPQGSASTEQLQEQLTQRDAMLLEKDAQIEEITERSLRSLADLENLRERSARQAETTRKFAVQGFAKSLLEVADNLERALSSSAEEQQQASADTAMAQLKSLRGGLNLTQKILMQVFQQNGLSRFEALGEKFDPNLHSALFEIPDPSRPAGTVATVTKAGYKLHDRVLRPAEVGVARAAPSTED